MVWNTCTDLNAYVHADPEPLRHANTGHGSHGNLARMQHPKTSLPSCSGVVHAYDLGMCACMQARTHAHVHGFRCILLTISSARMPLMPLSYRWIIQLRPCIWYSRNVPPVMMDGWTCRRCPARSPSSSSSRSSSSSSSSSSRLPRPRPLALLRVGRAAHA